MERVSISQFKNALSAYLDKVRAGETLVVCERDQPIARVERIGAQAGTEDRLTKLERAGLLRRASRDLAPDALRGALPKSRESVLQALLEDRAEGR